MIGLLAICAFQLQKRIEPEDILQIETSAATYKATVRNDGRVVVRQILFTAAGLGVDQLSETLTRTLGEALKVSVLGSARKEVRFTGDVQRSGAFPWKPGITLSDIVNLAVPRKTTLGQVTITPTFGPEIVVDFSQGQNPKLKAGDLVHFPLNAKLSKALIVGAVRRPGEFTLGQGTTLASAISALGGLKQDADPDRITNAGQNVSLSYVLVAGDVITIPTLPNDKLVECRGAVLNPGKFAALGTLSQVLRKCGLSLLADSTKVRLTRIERNNMKTTVHDLKKIQSGKAKDPEVKGLDVIDVEFRRKVS